MTGKHTSVLALPRCWITAVVAQEATVADSGHVQTDEDSLTWHPYS